MHKTARPASEAVRSGLPGSGAVARRNDNASRYADYADRNRGIPRAPVLGWSLLAGVRDAPLPSVDQLPNVVYTTSGHAAIGLALRALRCGTGDRILVPTFHCPTMIAPVVRLGATPVFYPSSDAGAPDPHWLARNAGSVRAMLVAHYFGFPQPLADVRAFCDAHDIALIEDCAHAFFGAVGDRAVGQWGDLAIASLTKFFPVPEGGCLASMRRDLASNVLARRSARDELQSGLDAIELGARYRRFPGANALLRGLFGLKEIARGRPFTPNGTSDPDEAGPPSASEFSDDLLYRAPTAAARMIATRAHRARIVSLRRRNYALLAEQLTGLPGAAAFRPTLPDACAPYVFPLLVHNPEQRYRALRAARVPIFRWDRVWPGTPSIEGDFGSQWATRMFQLACHQDLSEDDVAAITDTIRRVFADVA